MGKKSRQDKKQRATQDREDKRKQRKKKKKNSGELTQKEIEDLEKEYERQFVGLRKDLVSFGL